MYYIYIYISNNLQFSFSFVSLQHIWAIDTIIFRSSYNIVENTLMKVDNPVDAPTTVSMLIYINKESQVSILALVQF